MNAKYWQRGETLDYTPTVAVANGAVVSLTTRIGIAVAPIPANEQGQIHVTGVFELEKDGVEIAQGAAVYYDTAADKITTAEGGVPAGYAAAPAAAADATVLVKLLG